MDSHRRRAGSVKHLIGVLSFLLALAMIAPASAQSEVKRAPAADWVEVVPLPTAETKHADSIQGGLLYLVSEFQIRPIEDQWEIHDRLSYKVVDRTGVERAAALSFEYDPLSEEVTINRIHVIRDGKVMDRLASANLQFARREPDAERGMFDGRLTGYINLEDVRVGDIIDWSKTYRRRPEIGRSIFYQTFSFKWTVPVLMFRIKATSRPGETLYHATHAGSASPRLGKQGAATTYLWEFVDAEPIRSQPNAPPDYPVFGLIEISSAGGWGEIVAAVRPHYGLERDLPATFERQVDRIAQDFARPEDRMVEALRLIQDDIRYVSLAMGTGTVVPRSPADVISSGFGDCKDKSLLLAVALRRLSIDADVALTHTSEGRGLNTRLPGIFVFNHVIVRARIGGNTYWLDPTNYLQGGRAENLAPPRFAFALPLVEGSIALQPIPVPPLIEPSQSVSEVFDMPGSNGRPMSLRVSTTYRGLSADSMRYRLMNESRAKLSDGYIDYYQGLYPGIRGVAPLDVTDDRDANIIEVRERYELPEKSLMETSLIKNFPLKADIGLSDLPTPSGLGRTAPIWLGERVFREHRTLVRNLKARFRGPDNSAEILTPFAGMTAKVKATGSSFQVLWSLVTFTDTIPAESLEGYTERVERLQDNGRWTYDFSLVDKPAK